MNGIKFLCVLGLAVALAIPASATTYNITALALDTQSGTSLPTIGGTGLPGYTVNYITASHTGFNDIAQFTFNVAPGDTVSFDSVTSITGTRAIEFLVPNGSIIISTGFTLNGGAGTAVSNRTSTRSGGAGGTGGFAGGGFVGQSYIENGYGPGGGSMGPWGSGSASGGGLVAAGSGGAKAFTPAAVPGDGLNPQADLWGGSGGGANHAATNYYASGGGGGGAIGFFAGDSAGGTYTDATISFSGTRTISVNGGNGPGSYSGSTAGGGSGGTILLMGGSTGSVSLAGATLNAQGGGSGNSSGGGGGGEIAIYYGTGGLTAPTSYNVAGGPSAGTGHYTITQLTPSVITPAITVTNPTVSGSPVSGTLSLNPIIAGGSATANITVHETANTTGGTYEITAPAGAFSVDNTGTGKTIGANAYVDHAVAYVDTTTPGARTDSVLVQNGNVTASPITVNITGHVYDHASGSASGSTIALPTAIVGYTAPLSGTSTIDVSNAAGVDNVGLKTTGATTSNYVTLTNVAAVGQGTSKAISAGLDTGRGVGAISEVITRTFADDSALSGNSAALGTQDITVTGNILDHSSADFHGVSGAATPTLGAKTLTLAFGNVYINTGAGHVDSFFDIFANASLLGDTALLNLDSFNSTGTGDFSKLFRQDTLVNFAGQVAGTVSSDGTNSTKYNFRLDTSVPGTYTATYVFGLSDQQDLPGASGVGSDTLTLILTGTVVGPHMGDANYDQKVDLQDFSLLKAYYGQTGQGWEHGNFNGTGNDGIVNLEDFSLLKAHYNHVGDANSVPLTTVPEPATITLLLAGVAGLIRRRTR